MQPNNTDHSSKLQERTGLITKLKNNLVKARNNLGYGFIQLLRGKKIDSSLFKKLEERLLISDVGIDTTNKIIEELNIHAKRYHLTNAEMLHNQLRKNMMTILTNVEKHLEITSKNPFIILMVGVNGVGKTTTVGKLARHYQLEGKSVMLAAGDTFRISAIEQIQVWGKINRVPVVAQQIGADSASVIFDAIQAAKSRNIDVLIADTAGRLHNKAHLMRELSKVIKIVKKLDIEAPHEIMMVIDANTGQNTVNQINTFNNTLKLTGIVITKLDSSSKGGIIFTIADRFSIPIRYIGTGTGAEDLKLFNANDFIEALFT